MESLFSLEDSLVNCFSVDRYEPLMRGINILSEENRGSYVYLAKRCIYVDSNNPCRVAYDLDTGSSTVYRASVVRVGRADGFVDTLHRFNPHEVKSALVKVSLYADCKEVPNHELLKKWVETHAKGVLVAATSILAGYNGLTTMVKVSVGEKFSCYFPDGFVRTFFYTGQTLKEVHMTPIEMVRVRIDMAWKELRNAEFLEGNEKVYSQGCAISKALNLFFYLDDHELRTILYEEFFQVLPKISLSKELGELFEHRLHRTLYALDRKIFLSRTPLLLSTQVKRNNVVRMDDCRKPTRGAIN